MEGRREERSREKRERERERRGEGESRRGRGRRERQEGVYSIIFTHMYPLTYSPRYRCDQALPRRCSVLRFRPPRSCGGRTRKHVARRAQRIGALGARTRWTRHHRYLCGRGVLHSFGDRVVRLVVLVVVLGVISSFLPPSPTLPSPPPLFAKY